MKVLIAVALVGILLGGGGALAFGYRGTSRDCHAWAEAHGYQLVRDDWWAKTRGCLARTPDGRELYHDEEFRSKAIGGPGNSGFSRPARCPRWSSPHPVRSDGAVVHQARTLKAPNRAVGNLGADDEFAAYLAT